MFTAQALSPVRALVLIAVLHGLAGASGPAAAQRNATESSLAPSQMQLPASTPEIPARSILATAAKEAPRVINPVEHPYGLVAIWRGSDLVARFVLALLVMMSAGTWYILVTKLLEQRKISRQARTVDEAFWQAKTVSDGAQNLAKNTVYWFIAEAGARSVGGHAGLRRHIPLDDWVSMSIVAAVDRVNANTQKGLAFLATVGSTSPFIGLFGTVWGIYHALTAIGFSGQASIDKVAGPVGEALIMTAIGLAVAIPAVLAYNWLARRNRALMDEIREFGEELSATVIGSIQAR